MYTTRQNIEQFLNADLSAVDSFVTQVINSVDTYINKYCGKSFVSAEETRYYDGNGESCLRIDPFTGTPSLVRILEIDGTELITLGYGADSDYITYPLNLTEKNELRLVPTASIGEFIYGTRRVMITANFGGSTSVPSDIALVSTQLSGRILEKRLKGGTVTQETLGDYSVSVKDVEDASNLMSSSNILDQYVDIAI